MRTRHGPLLLVLLAIVVSGSVGAREVYAGNYRLHISCHGSGAPIVVLDAGLGGSALEWVLVQARLRETTRVCTYDRAGYGASDVGPMPRTSSRIANELYLLLDGAGEPPPYILVGHSFGGYNMQLFARRYPYLAAGLVLIDASHPEQVERFLAPPLNLLTAPTSSTGVVQFREPPPPHPLLPASVRQRIFARARSWKMRRTLAAEMLGFRDSARQVEEAQGLGSLPLIVITRGRLEGEATRKRRMLERVWLELQTELAAASTASAHLVARRSGHHIHIEQPDLVAYAIAILVERYRAGQAGANAASLPLPGGYARFKLDSAVWLRDTLSLYPEQVAVRAMEACAYAGAEACVAPTYGAP